MYRPDPRLTQEGEAIHAWKREAEACFAEAVGSNQDAESRLCDLLSVLRATFPQGVPAWAQLHSRAIASLLREKGREVNLGSSDPKDWITRRGGGARW